MLENTITLSVDPTGDNTTKSDVIISRFKEVENRTEYRVPGHTLAKRDQMEVYRNDISPSGKYPGNAKGNVKLTKDADILGTDGSSIITPMICQIPMSLPVGTTDEEFYLLLGRLQALVLDKALMYRIYMQQEI